MNHLNTYLAELAGRTSTQTVRTYSLRLRSFESWARKKHGQKWLGTEAVNDFLIHLRSQVKPQTIRSYQAVLNSFFTWLLNWEHITRNPLERATARVKSTPRSKKAVFTPEEYAKIKAEAAKAQPYWLPAVIIAWHTGLRLGDISHLERSEVDFDRDCLRLKPNKTVRFGTEVEIPLSGELKSLLSQLCANTDGLLLPSMAEIYQEKPEYLSLQFGRLLKRVGIKGKSMHSFRHGFCSRCLDLNVNPAVIATMTGQTLKVILGYSHPSLEAKREQMKGML